MNITSQFGEKTEISCIIFLINWIWLANKKQRTAPEGSSRGRPGVEGRPSDPDSLNSVFLAKHKWLKFILNQCQVPSAALSLRAQVSESTETEREDISCIISCSAKRCLSDLVHDTPPCFSVSSSLALFYGFCLSVCLCVCSLYPSSCLSLPVWQLSLHLPLKYPQPTVGSRGVTLRAESGMLATPSPLGDTPDAASHSTPIFWPHGQEGVFSVALGRRVQKAFPSPCLSVLHVWRKLKTPFFQLEVLVLAWQPALRPPPPSHTHTTPQPPHWNTRYFMFGAAAAARRREMGKKGDTVYLWKQTGRLLWQVQFRLRPYTNRKGERQVNVNVHYITIDCRASDVRILVS